MKKLICLLAAMMMLTACSGGKDNNPANDGTVTDGDGVINEEMDNNKGTDAGDVAEDAMDGAGDVAEDAADGAGDIVDGAADGAKDAARGVENAVGDMTGNRNKK